MRDFFLIVGSIALLFVAVVGYAGYANYAAESSAKSFCGNTDIGSDVAVAIARAGEQGVRHRGPMVSDGKEEHDFEFQGWVFNAGVCRMSVANGKVISLLAKLEGD